MHADWLSARKASSRRGEFSVKRADGDIERGGQGEIGEQRKQIAAVCGNSGTISLATSNAPKWPFSRRAVGISGPPSAASATQACAGQIPFRKITAATRSPKAAIPPGLRPFRPSIESAWPLAGDERDGQRQRGARKQQRQPRAPGAGAEPSLRKKGTVERIQAASRISRLSVE